MLSHRNLIVTGRNAIEYEGLRPTDEVVAYLPMAWIGDHMFSFAQSILTGFTTNCPESSATVLHDLREIGPTYFFAPPGIYQRILTGAMIRIEDAAGPKRRLVRFFLDVARRVERQRLAGKPVRAGRPPPPRGRASAGLRPAARQPRDEPRPPRLHRRGGDRAGALRVLPRPRRQHEAAVRDDGVERSHLHPAGRRGPARHRGHAADRRRGPYRRVGRGALPEPGGLRQGYYKNPEATRQTLEDGWVHSGDAGIIDRDGHLRIIDRARDVGRLADGTLFAPKYLENRLKFSPYIREAVCIGQDRPFVAALINIDLDRGRQLGRAARARLHELHRPLPEARGLRAHPARRSTA